MTRLYTDLKRRLWNWLVLFSHLLNVLLFNGDPQESLSARSYREQMWTERYIDAFFRLFGERRHCFYSYLDEVVHARLLLELLEKENDGAP